MIRDLVAKFIFYDDLNLARHDRVFSLLWIKEEQEFLHDPEVKLTDACLRFNSLDLDDGHFGCLWKGDSIDSNYDLLSIKSKFASLKKRLQEAKENPAGMDFRKDKMAIFLLSCESLQLSVKAKRNSSDKLCLWIENIKIGEEETEDFEDELNLARIFKKHKSDSPRDLLQSFVENFVNKLIVKTHFTIKPKTDEETFSTFKNYTICI